ncbi:hypothetical protein [Desulfosporosinus acididurans]|uniref:hypothetical protein n=1 Tax=Desulfosporosinus acididurans TaxID=476652 RepID=UPI00128BA2C1|nr:hypothetical protein [Desulfosporosinus acididurans]
MKTELDQHLIKERVVEFPLIKVYAQTNNPETFSKVMQAIGELVTEHEGAGRLRNYERSQVTIMFLMMPAIPLV